LREAVEYSLRMNRSARPAVGRTAYAEGRGSLR